MHGRARQLVRFVLMMVVFIGAGRACAAPVGEEWEADVSGEKGEGGRERGAGD